MAITALKPIVAALRMSQMVEAVNISPFVRQFSHDEGRIGPDEQLASGRTACWPNWTSSKAHSPAPGPNCGCGLSRTRPVDGLLRYCAPSAW